MNAINAIRYAESITPRWIRLAVSDEPNRWANDWATWQHQHLFVVHATDELGVRGISMDMRVKPGAASQGYGPVACGYAVPYNPLRPLRALENAEHVQKVVQKIASGSKHLNPCIVEVMMFVKRKNCDAPANHNVARNSLIAVKWPRAHLKVWTFPSELMTPTGFWIDLDKLPR